MIEVYELTASGISLSSSRLSYTLYTLVTCDRGIHQNKDNLAMHSPSPSA